MKKIKFITNLMINGECVGPDYETDIAEVSEHDAAVHIANGDAVEIGEKPKK